MVVEGAKNPGEAEMELHRLEIHEGARLRTIRLRALRDAPDAFDASDAQTREHVAQRSFL